jgi:hypothetical protein
MLARAGCGRSFRRFTVAGAAILLVACGPGVDSLRSPSSGSPAEAVGIVTSIQGSSPAQVSGFTLRTSSGQLLSFQLGRVQLAADSFPPGHLHEHLASAQPVRVTYFQRDDALVATRLRDGP